MKWFYDLKLGTKLVSAFILVALLAGVVGVVGIKNIREIDKDYTDLYNNFGLGMGYIGKASIDFYNVRAVTRDILLSDSAEDKKNYSNQIKEIDKDLEDSLKSLDKCIQTQNGTKCV